MPAHRALRLALILAALSPTAALADPIGASEARDQLYDADRVEVARYQTPGLSERDVQVLTTVAQSQKYYAAVAFAPDAGIMAEPTVLAADYHSIEAARAAALNGCNARRTGGAACAIALEVRPQGWQPRAVQLSADATAGFNDQYLRAAGPRALAISASSGQWGIGRGEHAAEDAVSACKGDTDVSDCAVVIAD